MALAMTRPTKDSRGVYEYKTRYPKDLAHLFKPHARWKRSLGTRDPADAAKRFPAVDQECKQHFALLRAVHLDGFKLDASDAQQLAARWFRETLAALEESGDYGIYLVRSVESIVDQATGQAMDVPSWGAVQSLVDEESDVTPWVAPFIRSTLEAHQYPEVVEGTDLHGVLVDAFWPVFCDLSALCLARMTKGGRYVPPPPVAPHAPLSFEAKPGALTLSQVFEKWAEDKLLTDAKAGKTVDEFGGMVRRFHELYGDMEVRSITRSLVGDFRVALGKLPTKGQGIRGLSAPQAIAKAEAEGLPKANLSTIYKQLNALRAILNFGVKRLEAMDEEPVSASGILKTLAKAAARQETRTGEDKSFTKADLRRMFGSPLFRGEWKPARADFGEALYWIPLLLAYTGARREEVAQLLVSDVVRCPDTGIWYATLRPDDDKSVKGPTSRRRVPLHADLLELGFVRYVESLPKEGSVFPRLIEHSSNGLGHGVGLAWGRYLRRELGMTVEAAPFHGFRHTFKTLCREVGVPKEVHDWLTGHSAPGEGDGYGGKPLVRMAEELAKYPSIARMAGLLP
ncbi:site-specific integrase [Pseudomonas sp. LMG 31766]|uniref:Site-specific integrase n=1 Tax=Pseudomonas chaetocerotis TaxID=2758695 RepID=A0A931GA82_9PSED|nr:site-specific integrase [Pseudomonas chaetocerotis]MBZ9666951.1 site-specific integrase [Pseudomonas chaetocerotis]